MQTSWIFYILLRYAILLLFLHHLQLLFTITPYLTSSMIIHLHKFYNKLHTETHQSYSLPFILMAQYTILQQTDAKWESAGFKLRMILFYTNSSLKSNYGPPHIKLNLFQSFL